MATREASFASFRPSHRTPIAVAANVLLISLMEMISRVHERTCSHSTSARGDDLALACQDLFGIFNSYCLHELLLDFSRRKESGVGLVGVRYLVRAKECVEGQGEGMGNVARGETRSWFGV